jgi:5-methylcytosine-specific restriction enzyme A
MFPPMPLRRPVHRPIGMPTPAARRAAYDRGRSRVVIYNTAHWQRLRKAYLAAHPLCECEANNGAGCGCAATTVDHKRPHNGDLNLAFDWDNLRSMTKACHSAKTAARDGGFGNPVR